MIRICLALCLCVPMLSARPGAAAVGDVLCEDSARMVRRLVATHGAIKLGQGLRGPDAVMEVWITPDSGDWALVQSYANGTSCIVAMGAHWQSLAIAADPA